MEAQRTRNSAAGNEDLHACRSVATDALKPYNVSSEEGSSAKARAILTTMFLSLVLMAAAIFPGVTGGGVTATVLELNDMFDRVWCPLPTWAHIALVIAAWALFFRVGADFVNTLRNK